MLLLATIGIISTGPGYTLFGLMPLPTADSGGLFGTAAEKAYILYGLLIGLAFGPVQASSRSYLARSVSPEEVKPLLRHLCTFGPRHEFHGDAALLADDLYERITAARDGNADPVSCLSGLVLLFRTPYPADRA